MHVWDMVPQDSLNRHLQEIHPSFRYDFTSQLLSDRNFLRTYFTVLFGMIGGVTCT